MRPYMKYVVYCAQVWDIEASLQEESHLLQIWVTLEYDSKSKDDNPELYSYKVLLLTYVQKIPVILPVFSTRCIAT